MSADKSRASIITRTTKVREIAERLPKPTIVLAQDEILSICEKVASNPRARTLAVVNVQGVLIGIIPERRFFDTVFLHIMPGEFLEEAVDSEALIEMSRESEFRTAQNAMTEPVSVTKEDTLEKAFEKMHKHRLSGLPVVDEAKRVVGYLDMLQVLQVWLEARRR